MASRAALFFVLLGALAMASARCDCSQEAMRFQELSVAGPMGRIKRSLADIEKTCSPKNLALLKAELDVLTKAAKAKAGGAKGPAKSGSKAKKNKKGKGKGKGKKGSASKSKSASKSAAFLERSNCACLRFREVAIASKAAKLKSAYDKIKKACNAKLKPISKDVKELSKKAAAVKQAEEQQATVMKPSPSTEMLHQKMRSAWGKIKRINAAELEKNKEFLSAQTEALNEAKAAQQEKLEDYATKNGEHEESAADKFSERIHVNVKKWDAILDGIDEAKDRKVMDKQTRVHKLDIEGTKDDERTVEQSLTTSVEGEFSKAIAKKDAKRKEEDEAAKEALEARKAEQKEWVAAETEKVEERVEKRCAKHKNKAKRKSCESKRRAREMYKMTQKEAQKFS